MRQSAAKTVKAKKYNKNSAVIETSGGSSAKANTVVDSNAVEPSVTRTHGNAATVNGRQARDDALASIDETVLRQMADLGFNAAQVIDSLATGKHNQ